MTSLPNITSVDFCIHFNTVQINSIKNRVKRILRKELRTLEVKTGDILHLCIDDHTPFTATFEKIYASITHNNGRTFVLKAIDRGLMTRQTRIGNIQFHDIAESLVPREKMYTDQQFVDWVILKAGFSSIETAYLNYK